MVVRRGMSNLWRNCSADLQQKFPFVSIPLDKPFSLSDRLKYSLTHGNTHPFAAVVKGLQAGKPIRDILQENDIPGKALGSVRAQAKMIGIEVPYLYRPRQENEWTARMLAQAKDKAFVRALLTGPGLNFVQRCSKGPNRCFVSISDSIREVGYHFRNSDTSQFVKVIQKADIPFISFRRKLKKGKNKGLVQRYYFTTIPFQNQVKEAFANSKKLDKFKKPNVTQIAGPKTDQLPTTTDFVREKNYRSAAKLLKQINISIPKGYNYETFIAGPDCPVTLFRWRGYVCYSTDQDEAFRKWILDRFKP